jgi:HlyD family secretion protein
MKRRSIVITLLAGLVATALSACGASTTPALPAAPAAQATAAPLPTAELPTAPPPAEIALGISGGGEVKAAQDADLVFLAQGTIAEVKVKEGDIVKKGDLLAILDTRAFDQQLHQAEAALANAQAQEAALTEEPRSIDAAAAAAQVQQAQAALTAVKAGPKQPDIASAQAGLTAAQANLQSTRDRLSLAKTQAEAQAAQAAEALTQAQARYAQTKINWDYATSTGNDPIVPEVSDPKTGKKVANKLSDGQLENYYAQFVQAEAAMHQAEQAMQVAVAAAATARQSEITGIQAAEQQLIQAQALLDKLQLPPDKAQLAMAQAGLAQARAAQARLTAEPRDAQKAAVTAGIAQAEAALELAQINREHAEIRAPFDGVVAAINVDPGDPSTTVGQPAIRVVDVSVLHVDARISDIDIALVSVGQPAEVHADALPDKVFKGKVTYIAPTTTAVGTIRTYLVRIALDSQDGLRAGMSARVDLPTK